MASKFTNMKKFMPKLYKAGQNPMLTALLEAWAGADEDIATQLKNTKAQLFVKTAEGTYLDRAASNFGVTRPAEMGLLDEDFQELIPNLSLKAKQVAKSFYDTMDVFWGPSFSRTNLTSSNTGPFNISEGDSFTITLDGGDAITVTAVRSDIEVDGAATAAEIVRILNRIDTLTATVEADVITSDEHVNIRTNTPGPRGSIEIASGSFNDLGFVQDIRHRITSLDQRTVLYQLDPGEIIIELPAVVPTLRRNLQGSHHFHADSTLESEVPPENGIWQGSFLYSRDSSPYTVTKTKALLEKAVLKGSVITEITLSDTSDFPSSGGNLIFNFGQSNQENPVKYIAIPNSKTILVDPGHTFAATHPIGAEVNLLLEGQNTPYVPRTDGSDLPVYLTSPANARSIVQEILESLSAAGITVKFVILLPIYKYLYENPYDV